MHLFGSRSRCFYRPGDVERDHVPLHRLVQGLVQGNVELVHAGRCEAGGETILVEARKVSGSELLQLQPTESGLDVDPDGYLVAVEGALSNGATNGAFQPRV